VDVVTDRAWQSGWSSLGIVQILEGHGIKGLNFTGLEYHRKWPLAWKSNGKCEHRLGKSHGTDDNFSVGHRLLFWLFLRRVLSVHNHESGWCFRCIFYTLYARLHFVPFVTGVFCLYEQKRTCPGMENCGKPLSNFCTNLASLWQKICHLYPGLCATKFQTHFTPKIVRMIIDMYVEPIFHGFIAAHWHLWSTLPGGRLPTSHRCWPPAIFVRLSRLLAYFNAQTPGLATARFDLPDHQFGTASPPIVATLISL